jgi:hypothetical protein
LDDAGVALPKFENIESDIGTKKVIEAAVEQGKCAKVPHFPVPFQSAYPFQHSDCDNVSRRRSVRVF